MLCFEQVVDTIYLGISSLSKSFCWPTKRWDRRTISKVKSLTKKKLLNSIQRIKSMGTARLILTLIATLNHSFKSRKHTRTLILSLQRQQKAIYTYILKRGIHPLLRQSYISLIKNNRHLSIQFNPNPKSSTFQHKHTSHRITSPNTSNPAAIMCISSNIMNNHSLSQ